MADPLRTDPSRARDARSEPDRTAKIEQLLLDGLDHYFNGQYEQAVNVWTRALFIDRTHARARAYIERARAALAERQRQSEELLHSGVAAFDRGESSEARRLLVDAIRHGAPTDEAMAVLGRLDRMDAGSAPAQPTVAVAEIRDDFVAPRPVSPRRDRSRGWFITGVLTIAVAGAAWLLAVAGMESVLPFSAGPADLPPAPVVATDALPMPVRGEIALERARGLAARGRLHDAIVILSGVRTTDPHRPEAERVMGELQQQLIELAPLALPPLDGARVP